MTIGEQTLLGGIPLKPYATRSKGGSKWCWLNSEFSDLELSKSEFQ
jgi:hypothetical protein